MSNTIKLKRGSGSDPSASDLSVGELAIRTDNGKIFTKKDNGSVAEISGGGGGIDDGDKGDITVSNGGDTFTIDSGVISTAKIADNAVNLGKLFQHNLNGFIATNANADCTVPTFPSHSGDTFVVHDLQLNRDSSNNDPVISPGSQATITFKTSTSASGAFGSILDGTGLQLGRNTEYVKLAAPQDQSGQASYTLTFPPTSGSNNQFLQTDGSGTTSWASVAFLSQNQVIALYDQSSTPVQRVLVQTEGVTIQGTSAAVSKLMFRDRTTANFLKFKPVDTLPAGVEFTLPSADGSANHVLKTDGSGVMSFGTIVDASVASDAAIAGSKISPDFGSQNISTTGTFSSGAITASSTGNASLILDAGTGSASGNQISFIDLKINGTVKGNVAINEGVSGTPLELNSASGTGAVQLFNSGTKKFETSSDGATITGRLTPAANNTYGLGTSSLRFANFFAVDGNFSGTITGNVTGNVTGNTSGSSGSCTGNAATATKLANARTIAGVSFDGSADISLNNNAITNGAGYITSADGGNAATLDSLDSTQFLRSDANDTATGTLTVRDILLSSGYHLMRSNHHSGHLEGSYNNVGANSYKSNPIYSIGSSYNPTDAALSNFYGIGYTHTNASFISFTGASGWGLYVAADGDARIFLGGGNGVISSTGQHYVGSNVVWNAGNDGSGSGLDADTLDGVEGSSFARSDANDTLSGQITLSGGVSTNGKDYYSNNGAFMANDSNGAFASRTGSNIDHIWHSDSSVDGYGGTWNFCSDTTYKAAGNSRVVAGAFYGDGSNLTGISAGGATGGGSDEVFYENDQTVTTSYTITNGKNAMAAGPITINSGVTVTIGSGETLTIV